MSVAGTQKGEAMKGIVGVLAFVLFASGATVFAADKAAIVYIEGDVSMNGSPAAFGDEVLPGAVLTTAKDSIAESRG